MRETIRCLVEFFFISYTSNKIRKCFSQILSLYNQTILFIKCVPWPWGAVHHILGPGEPCASHPGTFFLCLNPIFHFLHHPCLWKKGRFVDWMSKTKAANIWLPFVKSSGVGNLFSWVKNKSIESILVNERTIDFGEESSLPLDCGLDYEVEAGKKGQMLSLGRFPAGFWAKRKPFISKR